MKKYGEFISVPALAAAAIATHAEDEVLGYGGLLDIRRIATDVEKFAAYINAPEALRYLDNGRPQFTKPEEIDLLNLVKSGDGNALNSLVESHTDWIEAIANILAERPQDADDLKQEGLIELLEAIKAYLPEKSGHVRLIHFAKLRVFIAMKRYSMRLKREVSTGKVPVAFYKQLNMLHYVEEALIRTGRKVSVDTLMEGFAEYAEKTGLSHRRLNKKQIAEILLLRDSVIGDAGAVTDASPIYTDEVSLGINLVRTLLSENDISVTGGAGELVEQRFGFEDGHGETYREIGEEQGVKIDTVRYRVERVLQKLGEAIKIAS